MQPIPRTEIQQLANLIKERFNPHKVILFGSYAYGTPTNDSDVDFLIIMDSATPRELAVEVYKILPSGIPFDIMVRTPEEIEERIKLGDFFIDDITTKGIVL